MQQTKRRSKKGVILLALTIALLVLAFAPSALAATQSVEVNNGATFIGTTSVALTLDSGDLVGATQVTVQDRYGAGPYVLADAAAVKIPIPANPYTYIMQSNLTPAVGGQFTVLVKWYSAANVLLGQATVVVTFDNGRVISVLDFRYTEPYDGIPAFWPGDWGVQWFGPRSTAAWNYSPANGDVHHGRQPERAFRRVPCRQ